MGLPSFVVSDSDGRSYSFPGERRSLLCFVKEDCPTCGLSMPLIQAAHEAFSQELDVIAIGQDAEGNATLVDRHGLTVPMLDDSELKVSFAFDLDTVPTVILADSDGTELRRFIGFGRDDWRDLYDELVATTDRPGPGIDWEALPVSRPGCGSKSVEPEIARRLRAEAEGNPLRARLIDIGDGDEMEFMYAKGLSDGFPVVPPTEERVLRMLKGTRRAAQEVVAIVPPNYAPVTIEKIAINAVMAGCLPEYLPVVIAAVEAMCTERFNIHGVMATTMGCSPVIVVNGPIRHRIGMNMQIGVLGRGHRANAAIGHAVMLVLRNVGGSRSGGTERSTIGSPAKYGLAFAEWEERSPWEPLHVERGFDKDQSVVTLFGMRSGPQSMIFQTSRSGSELAGLWGNHMSIVGNGQDVLFVVAPENSDTFRRDGWSKTDVRARMAEVSGGFEYPDRLHLLVAGGGAGAISGFFTGWFHGDRGSTPTSQIIEEV